MSDLSNLCPELGGSTLVNGLFKRFQNKIISEVNKVKEIK